MDKKDRDIFYTYLRVRPIRACSAGITQVRRPRYYWASWAIPESEGVAVAHKDGQIDVSFKATLPDPSLWVDSGWSIAGPADVALPTFMRPIPKKKPGLLAAGLNTTPLDARKR